MDLKKTYRRGDGKQRKLSSREAKERDKGFGCRGVDDDRDVKELDGVGFPTF